MKIVDLIEGELHYVIGSQFDKDTGEKVHTCSDGTEWFDSEIEPYKPTWVFRTPVQAQVFTTDGVAFERETGKKVSWYLSRVTPSSAKRIQTLLSKMYVKIGAAQMLGDGSYSPCVAFESRIVVRR